MGVGQFRRSLLRWCATVSLDIWWCWICHGAHFRGSSDFSPDGRAGHPRRMKCWGWLPSTVAEPRLQPCVRFQFGVWTKGSYFSAQYVRIARRRGPNKASVAVANSILTVAGHLLTTGALYDDPGADYFNKRHDPAIEAKRLQRRIEALGFAVIVTETAA